MPYNEFLFRIPEKGATFVPEIKKSYYICF